MGNYCPYTEGNVVYLQCKECEEKLCEKDWFFCGVAGTPLSMMKSSKQMSEYLDKMLAKRDKAVIAAESGQKIAALAAMYASKRGYSFISVANDDLPTYLAKQQQKGCVMFDGAENEREIENTCRELHIPLRHCKLEENKFMMCQKLVRDNIPAIIEKNGETCVTRKLTDKEYEDALTEKLQEEVKELLEAYTAKERSVLDCAEEMADVMEVMYAMGKTCAVSKREIEQVRSQKAAEKGTFSKKIFLVSTEK